MAAKTTFKKGQVVVAVAGISSGDFLFCLTKKDDKSSISYIPTGQIGIVVSTGNKKNVRVSWTNGTIGWVNADGIRPLDAIDER